MRGNLKRIEGGINNNPPIVSTGTDRKYELLYQELNPTAFPEFQNQTNSRSGAFPLPCGGQ